MTVHFFQRLAPQIPKSVFIADNATVIGDVILGEHSSVWYGCVLRGDVEKITVGARTNIQDLSMIHVTSGLYPTQIGDDVTIGHRVVLHGCQLGNRVLVGIGAIVLDGAEVSDDVMIAAGTLVPPGMKIPSGVLVMGSPAKIKRELSEKDKAGLQLSAAHYVDLAIQHKNSTA